MKREQLFKRVLSIVLVLSLLAAYAVPVSATGNGKVTFEKVDNSAVSGSLLTEQEDLETNEPDYADTDMVRVSIVLEDESTIDAGYPTKGIAANSAATAYREKLEETQMDVTKAIEAAIDGELDVVWNLTLAANIISANVEYSQMKVIEKVPGVESVVLETRYEPQESVSDATDKPNMAVASQMTGTNLAWESGYTGAGMRVAIIDTGLDYDHQSMDSDALSVALAEDAGAAGMNYEEYLDEIDLLDEEEISGVLSQLNVVKRSSDVTASDLYLNMKAPFAYNYIDRDLDVTHDNDSASEHGSHVAGIAVANRYVKKDGEWVSAVDSVGVVGNAPDAQIITMKVFGKGGGAYDSDYMAAIEDAIVLGCDSVNLSLGSASAGMTTNATYQDLLDSLTSTDTVVVMSAGNNSYWAEQAGYLGYPYIDAAKYHTGGSPGSYTNSLGVASVDNDGGVGNVFTVAERSFMYSETAYKNAPLSSLDTTEDGSGTEYDYVFITGFGQESDYEGIDVTGKVVFCSRGTTSFFEKGNVAAGLGAAATIIYNNQAGTINMDLTDYSYTAPCISITQAAGAYIKENSTAATTEAGVTYYTGKIVVSSALAVSYEDSDSLTMSSFSSWGVPGDLSIKPEITAPGGSIYSLNGAVAETDQYELMSGTSMAAPQIAGITALVKQSIEENGLSQVGMTDRALAQSLMMSTAVPMKTSDGTYYPIIQQGAGLVDTAAATSADSYITVDGQPDGKVKAELGDDPDRDGVYSFSFDVNNLTAEDKIFAFSADVFTQDAFLYYANMEAYSSQDATQTALFMDTLTTDVDANVSWAVNGEPIMGDNDLDGCDFNGDRVVDSNDAQALLDYVTGASAEIVNAEYADVNGDGSVSTYDAHVLLDSLGKDVVTVPANGSVTVTVTIAISDDWKAYMDTYYTSGAYIQAYVYAKALTNAEGVEGTSHSIPMLAYYGNWSDMSMFDIGSYQEYTTGAENRTPYLGKTNTNTFAVTYADEPDTAYYFGGNPLVPDETYMPERNAINAERGDSLSKLNFAAIRNAAVSRFIVSNDSSGETLAEAYPGAVTAAYYYPNAGTWYSTGYTLNTKWKPEGLEEGDQFTAALTLVPEYYVAEDGSVDWDALGDGTSLSVTATVDNTAPEMTDVSMSLTGKTLTVTASDNQYVAAAVLYNAAGTSALAYTGSKVDAVPGEAYEYTMDISGVNGKKFLLQVADYAMNVTTYEIEMQIGEEQPLPNFIAYDLDYGYWATFDKDSTYEDVEAYATSEDTIFAATIVDHLVFAATDGGELYVSPEDDLTDRTYVADMGIVMTDMAYNPVDGNMYGVSGGSLYTIDKLTGEVALVGEIGVSTNTLACDANGTFYCNGYGTGAVYSFTLETLAEPTVLVEDVGIDSAYVQTMEINPNDGKLYWNSYYMFSFWGFNFGFSYFYEIDVETGEYVQYDDLWDEFSALIIPEKTSGGGWSDPTDTVSGIQMSEASITVLRDGVAKLTATVQPWTATDRTVTWSSSDPSIATVDEKGIVTGIEVGTCTITATSNLDPAVSASCEVTVETVNVTLEGTLQDKDGNPMFFKWDMQNEETWTGGNAIDTSMCSATADGKGNYYIMDAATDTWAMHKVDSTGTSVATATNTAEVPLWDMEYSSYFSTEETDKVSSIYYYYFLSPKDPMNLDTMAFDLSSRVSYLTAITSLGCEEYWDEEEGVMLDTEHIVLLDNAGNVFNFWIYEADGGMSAWLNKYPSDLPCSFEGYNNLEQMYCSMVAGDDGYLYLSAFNGETNELYRLGFNESKEMYEAQFIGDVGQDVWPATLTNVTSNAAAAESVQMPAQGTMQMDAVPVSQEELAAAAESVKIDTTDKVAVVDNTNKASALAGDSADAPAGGLDAFTASMTSAKRPPVDLNGAVGSTDEDAATVTVEITADEAATNGLYTISYDPAVMSFASVSSNMDFSSFADVNGTVTFGFANYDAVAADTVVATVTFNCTSYHEDTVVTVKTVEVNDETVDGEPVEIPVDYELCPGEKFEDFNPDKWYHDAVDYVVSNGLMQGVSSTKFGVYDNLERAQLITILYRAAGEPEVEGSVDFSDVSASKYYYNAVVWAVQNDIVAGYADGTFKPNADVTRADMVTFFYRFAMSQGLDVSLRADLSAYEDYKDVPSYAKDAMQWAVAVNLINGTTATTLAPKATSQRAQAAAVLYNYMTQVAAE